MVRTIHVVFVENKITDTSNLKSYMFLCSNDNVKIGDIIKDPRYTPFMQVIMIDSCNSRIQGGFTLKNIQIELLNGRYPQDNDFDINKQRANNMENWQVNKVFYYEVNNRKFYDKSEADEYALKLFLTEEIDKLWKKAGGYDNYSIYVDKDSKTIIVHIYHKPIIDDWNVGHYGCSEPTIIDKSENRKYDTIKKFYTIYTSAVEELFKIADSIDIEKLSMICDEETTNKMILYKNMVEQLKNKIKRDNLPNSKPICEDQLAINI